MAQEVKNCAAGKSLSSQPPTHPPHLPAVTTLRFAAALYVFLFHIHINWPLAPLGGAPAQFLSLGAVGMSLFFILSGFILAYRYHQGVTDLAEYYFDRFARIYPVYFVAALVTVPFLITSVEAKPSGEIMKSAQYVFLVGTNLLLIQAWFPSTFSFWNNGGSWSISVEAFFYLLLPMALFLLRGRNKRHLIIALATVYLMSILPGLAFLTFPNPPPLPTYYAGPMYRLPEFLVGVICGLLYNRGLRLHMPTVSLVVSTTTLALLLGYGPTLGSAYITTHIYSVPLLAFIILSTAGLTRGIVYNLMSWRPLVRLGEISYSFYAFQAFLLAILASFHDQIVYALPLLGNAWFLAISAFILLALISLVSEKWLERRLRGYLRSEYKRRNVIRPNPNAIHLGN
ncbi:MAG: acyltransferase family protein [Allorhizobium sp.]